jgi:hypothetical protein
MTGWVCCVTCAQALAEEAATETLLHRSLGRELELELVARLDAEGSQQTLPTHVTGTGAGPAAAGATVGGIYEHGWLEAVRPLWSRHMGVENMGQVLYSLVRFIKPLTVLEVGAGYTSLFILQALRDNEAELAQLRMQHSGKVPGTGGGGREGLNATGQAEPVTEEAEWYVEECLEARQAVLHCVDNEEHDVFTVEHGGLGAVQRIAERLGLSSWLQVHSADAFDLQLGGSGSHSAHPPAINLPTQWDLVWLDGITTHERFPEYFRSIWQQVSDSGGLALVHSTLTNAVNRQWLCQLATPDRADDHGSVDQSSVIRAAFSFRLAPETADDVSGDEGDDNEEFLDAVAPSSSVQRGGCYDDDQARRAFETLDEDEAGWISDAMVEHGWTHAGIPAAASGLLGELLQRLESERVETGYVNVDEFRQLCKWAAESVGPVDATKSAEQPAVATGGASTKAAPVLPEELAAEVAAQIRALTDVSALCSDEAATAGNVADLTLEWDEPYSVTPLAFGLCALEMTCLLRTAADAKAGSTEADPQVSEAHSPCHSATERWMTDD